MRIKDIDTDNTLKLKTGDLDNLFSVYRDKLGRYNANLNETLYLDIPKSELDLFIPDYDMHWSLISHKLYGTTRLAWLLIKINKVTPNSIFNKVPAGMPIYCLSTGNVHVILEQFSQ